MNALLVSIMAKIAASQARVSAMEAANTHRLSIDSSISYDDADFIYEADILERLAAEVEAIHRAGEAPKMSSDSSDDGEVL